MLLRIDYSSDVPIYLQIRNQIVLGIAGGSLANGDKLPTIRSLADESGINMMTVSKAYQLLKQEGYIQTGRRSGAVVVGGPVKNDFVEHNRDALHLLALEARLHGLTKAEFLELCANAFEKEERHV